MSRLDDQLLARSQRLAIQSREKMLARYANNHAGITLLQGDPMFYNLIRSRKFWALIAGLLLLVVQEVMPNFPLDAEQVTNVIYVVVAFIIGTGLEDSAGPRG